MADQAATTQPPAPGSAEYDAAMADKFDKATAGSEATTSTEESTPTVATRPDNIPEKFWDAEKGEVRVEALAKSYAELEKAKSKPAEKAPEGKPEGEPNEAAKALADVGLNFDDFSKEFSETGTLSEESYKKLEDAKIPKPMVDAYIAGQKALAAQWENTGYTAAGGQEQYKAMTAWAADNLSHEEKVAFNGAVNGTEASMKMAIGDLKQRYEAANGKPSKLLGGANAASATGYESRAQVTAAMKDPRYKTDPAYRKSIEAKLAVTQNF